MRRIVFASLLLLLAVPAIAQEPPFTEKIDVNVVLVDATVTDRSGSQILGLTKDDFVVKEDGVAQEVASLDYFTNRRLLDTPESQAAFKVERVKEERYFILFFHELLGGDSRLQVDTEVRRAKDAAIEFVEKEMLPQDRIAVAGYDARLKIYADFTSDKKILRKALNEVVKFSRGLTSTPAYAGEVSIMRTIDTKKMVNDTGRIYDAIKYLAESLPEVQARKVLVLFSPGIGQASDFSAQIPENEDHWYRPMVQALNAENVSVYSVNLLRNVTGAYAAEQALQRVAAETGGEYFKPAVSFSTPLEQVEQENNGYYLLSYYSKHPKGSTGYQKIDVSLKNSEFRIKAREGYAY
jgi:VWFA-related protein